jgi:hypothetical protein
MEDGIELALAEQPGIEELDHPDREEMLVRTTLALSDVHAAAIRALLDVNRRPRALPPIGLPLTVVSDMAEGLIGALDWPGRLRMGREPVSDHEPVSEHTPSTLDGWHGCWRSAEPGLLQVVHLWYGLGEIGDGTQLEGTITVHRSVWDAAETSIREVRGREFPNGTVVAERPLYAVPPTVAGVVDRIRAGLGWFDHVETRQSIVDLWARKPDGIAPYPLWEKLEVAARWGFPDQARALLRHGHRHQRWHGPKFDEVARRYGL